MKASKLFFWFFLYSFLLAVFVQFILLPFVVPKLHWGHGLMVQTDSIFFHLRAAELATKMREIGWEAFRNRPVNGVIGIVVDVTAILYYFTGLHEPFVLIPLNAFLHASSAIILIKIIRLITGDQKGAEGAGLPFLLFPSAASWHTQILREGYFILGFYLILWGWLLLAEIKKGQSPLEKVLGLLPLLFGYFLVASARIYVLQIMSYLVPVLALLVVFRWSFQKYRGNVSLKDLCYCMMAILAALFLLKLFVKSGTDSKVTNIDYNLVEHPERKNKSQTWRRTGLPEALEVRLMNIATQRDVSRWREGAGSKSDIDGHIEFNSAWELVSYFPRAFQIGFLAPFPSQWFSKGEGGGGGGGFRKIAALEMLVVYIGLGMFLLSLPLLFRRFEFYVAGAFSGFLILIYSLAIVNVGALYRYRYGFLMLFVAIGFSSLQKKAHEVSGATRLILEKARLTKLRPSCKIEN